MLLSFFAFISVHHTGTSTHRDRRRAQCRAPGFHPELRWWLKAALRKYHGGVTIGKTNTRYPAPGETMKVAAFCAVLLGLPAVGAAKSETTRIEILHGKRAFVTLSGADSAGQFTIWSGPGAGVTAEDGTVSSPTHPGDIANWEAGAVQLPRDVKVYKVRFYCAAGDAPAHDGVPTHLCYGVRYAISRDGEGYIQIPAADDKDFQGNTQSIYRGVEGSWFRASARWEDLVRPRIDEALAPEPSAYQYQQPIYVPSRTAVSASPAVTPTH